MTTTHSDLKCRKWTLIGLTIASAIVQIILMIIAAKFVEGQLKDMKKPAKYSHLSDAQWEDAKVMLNNKIYLDSVNKLSCCFKSGRLRE